ncbi:MAG TPA: phosphotransferase, partial [Chloroflexota bacterium]|nr:phosphotransferase [Chloroflexota bacterium]
VDGRVLLIDWDTVGLAPAERDLWWLDADGLRRYVDSSQRAVDSAALRLYRLRWVLDDIASYLDQLRRPHTQSAKSAHAWRALSISVREAERFLYAETE